jgi:hypothetical protein
VYPQARKALAVNELSELIRSGVSSTRVARLVDEHGVAFELDERTLQRLKQDGATEPVLSAVKRMSVRYTEERQQKIKEQAEAAKRQQQEEAKRKQEEKVRADEEKHYQAELARQKQETQQRLNEIKQRHQEEARRKEEELKRAEEQKRQQAEAEKARQEELRRQEETRIAEEKRRVEEEARRVEAERRKEEANARSVQKKIEEEQRRAKAQSWMLDVMRNGNTSEPTYRDGEFWVFNVIENFTVYDSRALKGLYQLRYVDTRFQIFKDKQIVGINEAQIGILLAMVGRGSYMGGQYLKFPLSMGQKWSLDYQSAVRGSRTVTSWNAETTVKDVESITMPAGKLWAFKIIREAWSHRGTRATFTYHYSPQTKSIVKMLWQFPSDTRNVELVKFGSGQ